MHLPAYMILCLYAWVLAIVRVFISPDTALGWLVWNLILAVIPYVFALLTIERKGWRFFLFFFFWIIFFPNSLYIFTDFIHLGKDASLIHYDIVLIASTAIAGLIAGFASLELIHTYWNRRIHGIRAWIAVSTVMLVGVFAVFIGRFQRFNSWDLFHEPLRFLREVSEVLIHPMSLTPATTTLRATEQALYGANVINPYLFIALYFSFYMILYVFLYHTKKR